MYTSFICQLYINETGEKKRNSLVDEVKTADSSANFTTVIRSGIAGQFASPVLKEIRQVDS